MAEKVDEWDFGYAQLEEICKNPLGDVQPAKKFLDLKTGKGSWENPLDKDSAGTVEASGVTRRMDERRRPRH